MFQLKKNGCENIEFEISDNETDPNLIAAAATKFLFQNAEEEAKAFLERDEDFNKLDERAKRIIIKLLVNKIVEETIQKFKEHINKDK